MIENEAYKKFMENSRWTCFAFLYFHKKGIVQELIHNLKYKGHEDRNVARHWYAEDLKDVFAVHKPDVIIPVPLHRRKYKERGYNQVSTFDLHYQKN
jgi:predicted amidophosphoribosyltransferase